MTTHNTQPDNKTPVSRDALFETLAAELTRAAYCVALRHGTGGTWLDLELALWRTLADKVKTWERELPRVGIAGVAACTVQRRELT
jgi:hypothetical protein